mgnify:CR=1 FL=1
MGSFLNRLSAVGRSDGHQNVTLNSRKLTAEKRKNAKRGQFFSPRAVQGGQLGTRQGFLHFGMHAACGRELGLPNEIEGAVPIINAASAVLPSFMGIVPEEGSTLPWAVFLSQNLRIHAVVS